MFLFRIIIFFFQIISAVFFVLILQISVGGQTLETFLMSFIQHSKTTAPIRELAYSGVKMIPGSLPPSARVPASLESTKQNENLSKSISSEKQNAHFLNEKISFFVQDIVNQFQMNVNSFEKNQQEHSLKQVQEEDSSKNIQKKDILPDEKKSDTDSVKN